MDLGRTTPGEQHAGAPMAVVVKDDLIIQFQTDRSHAEWSQANAQLRSISWLEITHLG